MIFVAVPVVVLYFTQSVIGQDCSCPIGWRSQWGNSHCYFWSADIERMATFAGAETSCLPLNGTLIIINTPDEFAFFELLRNETFSWIGAKWDGSRSKWAWVNGEDVGNWTKPHWGALSEDSSYIYAAVNSDGTWVDGGRNEKHYYVCEKEGSCQPTSTTTYQSATRGEIDQKTTTYTIPGTVEEDVATANSSLLPQTADGVSRFLGIGLGAGGGLLSLLGCVLGLIFMKKRAVQRGRNKRNGSEITRVPADEENLTEVGMNEYEAIHDNEYASVDDGIVPFSNTANAIGTRGMQASKKEAALQSGDEDKEQLYAMPDSNHRARERGNGHIDDEAGTELVENDVYGD